MMDQILRAGYLKYCCCYLDDVLIYSDTFEEHVVHVREVMQRMEKAGLLLRGAKCEFFMNEAKYLGHIVGNGEIRMDTEKMQKIINFQVPTTVKEVQRFLGMCGYYRKFAKDFAKIAAPLGDLTKAGQEWSWTAKHQKVFEYLKELFEKNVVLKMPDYTKPFIIDTDASDQGIGAVLSQLDDDGDERPVYFASRKLSPAEKKWPVRDKEALAILYGCQTFRHHVLGSNFTVRTDHQSLEWLMDAPTGRIARWATMLAEYEPFTIVYRKGAANKIADAMSREYAQSECLPDIAFCFATTAKKGRIENSVPVSFRQSENDVEKAYEHAFIESQKVRRSNKTLREEYNSAPKSTTKWACEVQDDSVQDVTVSAVAVQQGQSTHTQVQRYRGPTWELKFVREDLLIAAQKNCLPLQRKLVQHLNLATDVVSERGLVVRNGIAGCESQGRFKPFLPPIFVDEFLKQVHAHPRNAHMGAKRTAVQASQFYTIPCLRKRAREICNSCLICLQRKRPCQNVGLLSSKCPTKPWEMISMDYCGPYVKSDKGFTFVLVIIDQFSKFVYLTPAKRATGAVVMEALIGKIFMHGHPEKLLSDNGPHFRNKLLAAVCQQFRIFQTFSSGYYAQGDGQVERFMRIMNDSLSCLCMGQIDNWELFLPSVQAAYNNTPHAATLVAPYEVIFGQRAPPIVRPEHVSKNTSLTPSPDAQEFAAQLFKVQEFMTARVRANVEKAWMMRAIAYNRNRRQIRVRVGENALVRLTPAQLNNQEVGKLCVRWSDPLLVTAVKESGKAFEVKSREGRTFVVNATRMVPLPPSTWSPKSIMDEYTWDDADFQPEFPGTPVSTAYLSGRLDEVVDKIHVPEPLSTEKDEGPTAGGPRTDPVLTSVKKRNDVQVKAKSKPRPVARPGRTPKSVATPPATIEEEPLIIEDESTPVIEPIDELSWQDFDTEFEEDHEPWRPESNTPSERSSQLGESNVEASDDASPVRDGPNGAERRENESDGHSGQETDDEPPPDQPVDEYVK